MDKDKGTIAALMERFTTYRLPRAERMLERVNAGETLTDEDMGFLDRVITDAKSVLPLVNRNPEYERLAALAVSLYSQIIEKATENEKSAGN